MQHISKFTLLALIVICLSACGKFGELTPIKTEKSISKQGK